MAGSLLLTKLFVPHPRPDHLLRPRLTRQLDEALARKLTLVCAPAGYGKTTLLAEWLAGRLSRPAGPDYGTCTSWLSLDATDSDPVRFASYLIAALRQIDPAVGGGAEAMLPASPPPPPEVLLTPLINELVAVPFSFLLVLDDYHLITSLPVHLLMAFLIDHQPPNMHLVIATRDDPPLPLAAWRAKGQVAEIRQDDLKFTAEETVTLLQRLGQIRLPAAEIDAVQQRTEGWAAGLELLAHSLRDCDDVAGLVGTFAGSNRYVLDYLMEEVFQRQPAATQDFLLQTSVLDRMSAALCDAVTGRDDGRALLLGLERRNLFVVPLDHSRQWYRYHHLFADLLRHRLQLQAPDSIPVLHGRACRWCSENGLPADAIRHALAAHAWEEAGALILQHTDDLLKRGQLITALGWYRALPDEFLRCHPEFCAAYAWPLILSGQADEAEGYLELAEAALPGATEEPALAGAIAAARAYVARFKGDGRRAVEQSERALALLPPDASLARGVVATNLGIIYWNAGNLARAEQVLDEAGGLCRRSGNRYAGLAAQIFLCKVHAARGRLRHAAAGYRRAIEDGGGMPLVALAHADLARLLYDRNEVEDAAAHAVQAETLSRSSGQPELQMTAARTMALIQRARGNETAVRDALAEVDGLVDDPVLSSTGLRHALAYRILIALMAGDPHQARSLADQASQLNELQSLPDYLQLSLAQARLLLAEDRRAEAFALLEEREARLSRAGFCAAQIDTHCLMALAAPSAEEGRAHLSEALSLAEPEGYMRPFIDLGQSMATLLREAVGHPADVEYAGRLLAAFRMAEHKGSDIPDTIRSQPLIEPLSERELEVLRLLAGGHTNDEIGRALYVSANTVKAHLKSIYRKLDVDSRRAAAARAGQLGLL